MVHVKSASLSSTKPLLSLPGLCKIENLMTPSSQPSVQIRPARAFSWADLLELWSYRDVLLVLAVRDIKLRYKQTVLGVFWVVLQPLLAGLIFALIFGHFIRLSSEGYPYLLFVFPALMGWQLFAGILQRAGGSLVNEARLITKVYFPHILVPMASAVAVLVDLAVSAVIMLVLLAVYGVWPGWSLLWLPVALFLALALAMGVSIWLAALNVRYRDFMHATPFLIQVWMYASPVVYSSAVVPLLWRPWFALNPMVGVIEAFRWAWLGHRPADVSVLALSAAWAAVLMLGGWVYFRRVELDLVDRL
jgi:lipopolysaccharide transport system permease protein